ncbi:MAG: transcriptional regulator [Reichenbachiella sp.]|uniref:transcriptional regulator n=1 Tax=Reichenbachiella sp. TaxID=2184521 RepID=UPI003299D631
MTSIVTGDIINSRQVDSKIWLPVLKSTLNKYGETPKIWEIYRGDSFQLEIEPVQALKAAIHLKATIKQMTSLDIRMGIGVGKKEHATAKITESNGEAFVNSGRAFDQLNNKRTIALITPSTPLNEQMKLAIDLALLTMNNWPVNAAQYIQASIEHPDWKQQKLAKHLGKSQGTISQSLNRAGFDDIMRLEKRYRELITNL